MTILFDRVWRVQIGTEQQALDTTQLRVSFEVKRSIAREPNTAQIKIYNLSEARRAQLRAPKLRIVVEAGYRGALAELFVGDVRNVQNTYADVDWITTVTAGDGERALSQTRVAKSFKGPQDKGDLLRQLGQSLTGQTVNDLVLSGLGTLQNGFVANGKVADSIDTIAKSAGLDWSLQSGKLQFRKRNQPVAGTAILLTAESGLVGAPDHAPSDDAKKPPRVRAKSNLRADLVPGRLVQIRSKTVNGTFVLATVTHRGDSHGTEWVTDIEGLEYK